MQSYNLVETMLSICNVAQDNHTGYHEKDKAVTFDTVKFLVSRLGNSEGKCTSNQKYVSE